MTRLILLYLVFLLLRGLFFGRRSRRLPPQRPAVNRPETRPATAQSAEPARQDPPVRPARARAARVRTNPQPDGQPVPPAFAAPPRAAEPAPAVAAVSGDGLDLVGPEKLLYGVVFAEVLAPPRAKRAWCPR